MHINKGENIPFFGRIYMFINFLIISFGISGSALLIPLVNGSTMFSILILSIVISFFLDTSGFAENFKKYKGNLIIVFMIFCVFNLFITKSIFIGSNLFNYIYIFGYFAIFIYYKKRDRERKIFVKLIIIDIFLKVIISLYYLNIDPYIMRDAAFTGIVTQSGAIRLVYGATHHFCAAIIIILSVYFSKFTKTSKNIAVLLMALCFVLIYKSGFSAPLLTVIVILIVGTFIQTRNLFSTLTIVVVAVVVLWPFIPSLSRYLADSHWFGYETTLRLYDVANVLEKNFVATSFDKKLSSTQARTYFYQLSFNAFKHNFFLGMFTPNYAINGGHSTWLDIIAQFGIVMVLPLFLFIKNLFNSLRSNAIVHRVSVLIFLYFLPMGIFNAFSMQLFFIVVLFIMPYMHEQFTFKNEELTNEGTLDN